TPLCCAAEQWHPRELILKLVEKGALLEFRDSDTLTPLHRAAAVGNFEAIKALLDLGQNPNVRDARDLTPLYHAVSKDVPTRCITQLLYDHAILGVMDDKNRQEIHQACLFDRPQHLEQLIIYGADLDAQTANLDTPLHICALNNHETCLRLLLKYGATRDLLNASGQTPSEVAMLTGLNRLAEIIDTFTDDQIAPVTKPPVYNQDRKPSVTGPRAAFELGRERLSFPRVNSSAELNKPNSMNGVRPPILSAQQTVSNHMSLKDSISSSNVPATVAALSRQKSYLSSSTNNLVNRAINGQDVTRASHYQVTDLIVQSGSEVTLTVLPGSSSTLPPIRSSFQRNRSRLIISDRRHTSCRRAPSSIGIRPSRPLSRDTSFAVPLCSCSSDRYLSQSSDSPSPVTSVPWFSKSTANTTVNGTDRNGGIASTGISDARSISVYREIPTRTFSSTCFEQYQSNSSKTSSLLSCNSAIEDVTVSHGYASSPYFAVPSANSPTPGCHSVDGKHPRIVLFHENTHIAVDHVWPRQDGDAAYTRPTFFQRDFVRGKTAFIPEDVMQIHENDILLVTSAANRNRPTLINDDEINLAFALSTI
ncbi:SH3 and multiple ankyrin repeat domains protein 3, partial [Fasciolopsis buskii]